MKKFVGAKVIFFCQKPLKQADFVVPLRPKMRMELCAAQKK
jgi:hypothetical protein